MASIKFKINGKDHAVGGEHGPDVSLNEYLRYVADLKGTKAMCHEGGCGACVVAVKAPHPVTNESKIFAVNSCLVSVLSCHGWEVVTVEGIGGRTAGYHEIQTRLANFYGSQCGYCTPGWVMNMYSLYESKNHKLTAKEVENSFASNICRCTGYRPIADAFKSFATDADQALVDKVADLEDLGTFKQCGVKCSYSNACSHKKQIQCHGIIGKFGAIKIPQRRDSNDDWNMLDYNVNKMIEIDSGTHKWFKAYTLQDVYEAIGDGTDYKFVAGNTGQGVYPFMNYPTRVVDIFNVAELKGFTIDVNLVLGAGTPLSEMMELFLSLAATNDDFSYLKQFHEHMDLVAHIPVRNIGTIAGNLFLKYYNNEFQSDVFLLFESVGAMVTLASKAKGEETVSLLQFLKTDMKGKIMVNVILPPLSLYHRLKTYKIMPRAQNAHAVVNSAFIFKFDKTNKYIEKATIVFGSISPTFVHAYKTEQVLVGKDLFTDETLQLALKTLNDEVITEEAPPEPSGRYRKMLALSLFYKAILYLCPADRINSRYRSGGEVMKRSTSKGTQIYDTDKTLWPLTQPIPKLEGLHQCAGEATFANDLPTEKNEVFGSFVLAETTPGSVIVGFDQSEAMKLPGVIAFYTAKDIPGDNTFTPLNVPLIVEQEEILCSKTVLFHGQPAAIIVANREKLANKAAKLVKIIYAPVPKSQLLPLLTIDDVMKSPLKSSRVIVNQTVEPTDTGSEIKSVIYGEYKIESQYHYTMEPQTCVTKPTEDGFEVYSSTQWLDLTNVAVAQALKVPLNSVNVIVRRVGGAYGSKISRATQIACASALVSRLQGKTCRFILPLVTNMKSVGKRASVNANLEIGVNKLGVIQYLKNRFLEDNGCSNNDTIALMTVPHIYNCYEHTRWFVEAASVHTDVPSVTWCRAPGATEGIAMAEYVMEMIADSLNLDPIDVRLRNMKKDIPIPELIEQLKKDSDYLVRKEACDTFNRNNRWRKRAIKILTMSYDLVYFGNFNSMISILHGDSSIVITHGGIEMGQGINTKVAQVAAYILGAPLEKVSVKPSASFTSPNAIVTGGSIGSECVAFATMKACQILLERLGPIKEKLGKPAWQQLIEKAYAEGVDLQASYMYTSKDGLSTYDIYGVVILEVEVDVLTGNHEVLRVDILEDTGRSMSPEVDVGQIEGAFVMGLGYWTSEKLMYDPQVGELITNRTWTYKPPGLKDVPADMRVYFRRNADNPSGVLQSKATGEPAMCLAVVVTHAIREAVTAARLEAGYPKQWLDIEMPYTTENIFNAAGHKLSSFTLK